MPLSIPPPQNQGAARRTPAQGHMENVENVEDKDNNNTPNTYMAIAQTVAYECHSIYPLLICMARVAKEL
eukprot:13351329-Ditylum_brightwellii.AAC.1